MNTTDQDKHLTFRPDLDLNVISLHNNFTNADLFIILSET